MGLDQNRGYEAVRLEVPVPLMGGDFERTPVSSRPAGLAGEDVRLEYHVRREREWVQGASTAFHFGLVVITGARAARNRVVRVQISPGPLGRKSETANALP